MLASYFFHGFSSVNEFPVSMKTENVIEQEERRNGGRENPQQEVVIFKVLHFCLPPFLRSSCSMLLFQTLIAARMN